MLWSDKQRDGNPLHFQATTSPEHPHESVACLAVLGWQTVVRDNNRYGFLPIRLTTALEVPFPSMKQHKDSWF
jgi:hypothetical protein